MITGYKHIIISSLTVVLFHFTNEGMARPEPVDTIRIPIVTIYDTHPENNHDLLDLQDSADVSLIKYKDIGLILQNRSPVHIRTYGPGLIYSLSNRGSNSAQVAIMWNDILINHPLPGMADLSLIRTSCLNNIRFNPLGSQEGIAGTLELNDQFDQTSNKVSLYGSLHSTIGYDLGVHANFLQNKHLLKTDFSVDQNLNAYKYKKNNEYVSQLHAATRFAQFKTSYQYLVNRNSYIGIHVWMFDSHREIPASLYEKFSDAIQNDQAIRTILYYQLRFKRSVFRFQSAFLRDLLQYESQNKSILTNSTGNKLVQQIRFSQLLTEKISLNAQLENEFVFAESSAYPNPPSYNQTLLRTELNTQPGQGFTLNGGFKTGIRDRLVVPFSPFFQSGLTLGKNMSLMLSAGKNFRFPGFNDYYWPVGGNPELKPESATEADFGIELKTNRHITIGTHAYIKNIRNWIIWLPKQGLFYAQNMDNVRSYGLEANFGFVLKNQKTTFASDLMYHFNKTWSLENNPEKFQMIYTPVHSIKHMAKLNFRSIAMTIFQTWTSSVYTSSDNAYFLKPYYLLDISFDRNFKWGHWSSRWFFSVNNLLNNNYQTIENYPMPGINVQIGFKTDIFRKNTFQKDVQDDL